MTKKIEQIGALLMVGVALAVLSYLAINGDNDAKIALISVIGPGLGFFLRAKVAV